MFRSLRLSSLIRVVLQYKLEILLSICLFSNLYPDIPSFLYYILWVSFLYILSQTSAVDIGRRAKIAYGLILLIICSTIVNVAIFDYRWILMCILLYITLCRTSYRFFKFKERFLFVSLFGYVITGLLNNYAHRIGFNYQLYSWKHLGEEFTIDFSGFTNHPMWLSAACGIGVIFLTYWMNILWSRGRKLRAFLFLLLIFLTLQTLVWGGSRSALGICICASLLLIWLSNKNIGKTFFILCIFAISAAVITPILMSDADKMKSKINHQEATGKTSRDGLWDARFVEFVSSPIWGIGFGVTGVGEKAVSGRAETGSGWLTILSQTGLAGFVLAVLLVRRAILPLRMLRNNLHMALYTSLLFYLSLHTLFEAYIFQSGWYLCFVYWLTVSILDDYRKYYKILNIKGQEGMIHK
ncbi:O-antigen ligase family protein [Bacteroides stercoris]|mgnify:FL=1|jgi:hypothetical protein|uniref:O-antigen ligase family protein n=1 Tax=Bacteroides stercoris TaxID=46506 RepID=UPI00101E117A|nr:O-antigen ligase family protein [Bacteroides stercoris]